jgi:acetolactate decarboxylase
MIKKLTFFAGILILFISCEQIETNTQNKVSENEITELSVLAENTSIRVIDTDFSKGRLTNEQTITLDDVQKMHGHLCDGLVVGFLGLQKGLYELYPDSIIDRTNTRIVAKSSPCIGDAGMYLSGGRYQFNTFYIDNNFEGLYIIQRNDTKETISVSLKPGITPKIIGELGAKAVKKELESCELDTLKKLEDDFSMHLLTEQNHNFFKVKKINFFQWSPVLRSDYIKTDVLNKEAPACD